MEKLPHAICQLLAVLLGAPAVSYSRLLHRAKSSAITPRFAEISPKPAAPAPQDRVLTPATPHCEPGTSGPKSKAYKAAGMSYAITSFFAKQSDVATSSSSKAASAAASAAQHEDEDKIPNPDASASETSSSVAEPSLSTTALPKSKGGFKTGSRLCPGVNCEPHPVRTRRDNRAQYVCA